MKNRIYIVSTPDGQNRLVRSATRHQAVMHVANALIGADVATQDQLVDMIGNGVKVENYKDVDQPELSLED